MASSSVTAESAGEHEALPVDCGFNAMVLPNRTKATFLNEGAANIIYRITTPHQTQTKDYFGDYYKTLPTKVRNIPNNLQAGIWAHNEGRLLRLRKKLAYVNSTLATYTDFVNYIKPLFLEDEILAYDLVDLRESDIIQDANEELRRWEAQPSGPLEGSVPSRSRDDRRKGIYLASEPYGLLVDDMTPPAGTSLIEFKPKWLQQSPAAPTGSKRCRTCAKRARNTALKIKRPGTGNFCPLDLTSMDYEILIRPAKAILKIRNPPSRQETKKLHDFCEWLRNSVIHKLAALQKQLDPDGVFVAESDNPNFLIAMALRDCSIFLQIPTENNLENSKLGYVAKLGDLDLKTSKKANYWREVEKPLIDEGWYMGTEAADVRQPLDCGLYPLYWALESKGHLLVVP